MMRSIRTKLTLWYIGSLSALILVFGVVAFFSLKSILMRTIDTTLHNSGKSIELYISEDILQPEQESETSDEHSEDESLVEEFNEMIEELFFADVVYVQLREFPEHFETPTLEIVKTAALKKRSLPLSKDAYQAVRNKTSFTETIRDVFPFPVRVMTFGAGRRDMSPYYILQLGMSLQDVRITLRNLLFIFSFLFPGVFIIISVLGYVFMKKAFSPVKKMVAVARSITAKDLSLRLDPMHSHDEIGELADTLNEMISRLEQSFIQIEQFSGDVSHELKTPLTVVKGEIEVALRKARTEADYQDVLKSVLEENEKLQKIIGDLLFLARMDSQSSPPSFTALALDDILFEVHEETYLLAKKHKLSLMFTEVEPLKLRGDSGLLKRLLSNLIVNAIQYTASGGEIRLSLQKKTDRAVCTITDTGIGIPEDTLPYIFDRFYRVDPSRSHDTGGSGLGLAIVQKIVEVHGGHISVQSTVGQGTTFRVFLPCIS